ncbi:hypothetical protein [Sporomusa termitida]|uniref:hypothetical protein n=1 Tax=Sporomusa termitida TaxID=2377 RepID=UPI001478D240|nr:hypothetical protein [Sporomusa termitida]
MGRWLCLLQLTLLQDFTGRMEKDVVCYQYDLPLDRAEQESGRSELWKSYQPIIIWRVL